MIFSFFIFSIVWFNSFNQSYLSYNTSSCKSLTIEYPFSFAHFSLYLSFSNCSSGDDQLLTCIKCCLPSNSIIILYSSLQKSKGRNVLFLHHSCLY